MWGLEIVCRVTEAEEKVMFPRSLCLVYRLSVSESEEHFFVLECGLMKGFGKKLLQYFSLLRNKRCLEVNDLTPEDLRNLGMQLGDMRMPTPQLILKEFQNVKSVAGDNDVLFYFDTYPSRHKNTPVLTKTTVSMVRIASGKLIVLPAHLMLTVTLNLSLKIQSV